MQNSLCKVAYIMIGDDTLLVTNGAIYHRCYGTSLWIKIKECLP